MGLKVLNLFIKTSQSVLYREIIVVFLRSTQNT